MIKVSRVEYGRTMEEGALKLLTPYYDSVEHIGKTDPIDILTSNNNVQLGINVKSGKKGYMITIIGFNRLISRMPDITPCYLFINASGSYLFQLVKTFPPLTVQEEMTIVISGKGRPTREKRQPPKERLNEPVCPECGSSDVAMAGTALTRKGKKQRWQCKKCARKFIPSTTNEEGSHA